ncbi:hypothetical protein [Streptomyces cadmiisoli]|uniref:hypothetical protein n=1 Tax=Streptomyces cadmiisoli TaxID=2184053 RepID=UPI00365492DB
MIEYVPYSGEPEAMNCPAVICDTCRKQVVGQGNVIWCIRAGEKGEQRQISPIFAAHKGRCDRALELWLRGQYPIDDHWINLWEEVEVFMKQFNNNVSRSFDEDPQGEYHQTIVKMPGSPHDELPQIS